jgi:catechol 2,3-dioxygenase-like lactoylglutathione lyase family enzyme
MRVTMAGVLIALALPLLPRAQATDRPKVLGIAHVAFYVSDLTKTRAFYKDFLGFDEEPFTLKKPDGSERIAFIKINDEQYIELFAEAPKADGRLNHVSIYTDNADRMRDYLAARGVKVPEKVGKGQTGNKNFTVRDPDDHGVEIVEYQPDSWTTRESGKHMPDTHVSTHIVHAGFAVSDPRRAMAFYNGILGFTEQWRGSSPTGAALTWVDVRVPDGNDYFELMLDSPSSSNPDVRATKNHVSLIVEDAQKTVDQLKKRAASGAYTKPLAIEDGANHRRQITLSDPDGTRIELIEAQTAS